PAQEEERAEPPSLLGKWICAGTAALGDGTRSRAIEDSFEFVDDDHVIVSSNEVSGTYALRGSRFTLKLPAVAVAAEGRLDFVDADTFHQVTDAPSKDGRVVHRDYRCTRD
ncbi:hypothetical protein, partial [Methylogaea oryzae]